MTGYETYTSEELDAMARRLEADMRYERTVADGDGLRAEVARSHVRTYQQQIAAIRATLADRKQPA